MAPTVHTPPINTYIPIGSITLSASTSSVTFSGIPVTDTNSNSLRDLVLVVDGTASAFDALVLEFNGDTTGSNYSYLTMYGTGSTQGTTSGTGGLCGLIGTSQSGSVVHIQDYNATDKHTTFIYRGNVSSTQVRTGASRWANTAAVSSIKIYPGGQTFSIGTTVSLYALAG